MQLRSLGNVRLSGKDFTNCKLLFHQDLERCDSKGRDCIENNFTETYNCSTTCVGINADVQWAGKVIEEELKEEKVVETRKADSDGKINDTLLERFFILEEEMKRMKEEINVLKNGFGQVVEIATGQRGEELDKKKFKKLISEYRKFKVKNVKHFRFNLAVSVSRFGRPKSAYSLKKFI